MNELPVFAGDQRRPIDARSANAHVADLVDVINELPASEASRLIAALPFERAVEVFDQPGLDAAADLIEAIEPVRAAAILGAMSADRAADLLRGMDGPSRERLMEGIEPEPRQGIARIQLAFDRALRPGGFASAQIVGGVGDQPQLPQSAILSDDNGNYVFVVDRNNVVQRRNVRLGTVTESDVAIADGLSGNERVVLSAGAFLNPGQKIAPVLGKAPVGAAR